MSHHASGPNFGFPRGDARLDMTDLYAFTKPGDAAKSIIVLNVHPSFALNSHEPTTSMQTSTASTLVTLAAMMASAASSRVNRGRACARERPVSSTALFDLSPFIVLDLSRRS